MNVLIIQSFTHSIIQNFLIAQTAQNGLPILQIISRVPGVAAEGEAFVEADAAFRIVFDGKFIGGFECRNAKVVPFSVDFNAPKDVFMKLVFVTLMVFVHLIPHPARQIKEFPDAPEGKTTITHHIIKLPLTG